MKRLEAFELSFDNVDIKIVAAGHEQPLKDVAVCVKDEYCRSIEFLLNKHDVILLAKALSVTGEDF